MRSLLDPAKAAIVIDCARKLRPSGVCLACLHADGRFELLTGAWQRLLGYGRTELGGLPLRILIATDGETYEDVVRRMLDPSQPEPVLVTARAKSGALRRLNVYRRFEARARSVYFACDPFEAGTPAKSASNRSTSALSSK